MQALQKIPKETLQTAETNEEAFSHQTKHLRGMQYVHCVTLTTVKVAGRVTRPYMAVYKEALVSEVILGQDVPMNGTQ